METENKDRQDAAASDTKRIVMPPEEHDYSWEDENDFCSYCGGQGWGIVGVDWDTDDVINGPYDGDIEDCPNCHGSGKAEDMTFW